MLKADRIDHRLKLRELRTLIAVAEAGSMGKAAERLHVTQPVVSKTVASLEHTLGVRLLDRTVHGVELTGYGRAVLDCSLAIFDDIHRAIEQIDSITDPTSGVVRVGCSEPEFAGIVPAVIERICARYPRIEVHLVRTDQLTPYRELEERKIDLTIARLDGASAEDHLHAEFLFTEPMAIAAGVQSPWARRRRVQLAELADEAWILPPSGSFAAKFVLDAFHAQGLRPPRPAVVCTSTNMRIALLMTGRFLTPVPGATLRIGSKQLMIKALPLQLPHRERSVGIITLKGRSLTPVARKFVECAREVIRPLITS
jgi:DNA-binding transcriptional LysR family regulator